MQISLRKANNLQIAINEVLRSLDFSTEVSINEFQNPKTEIQAAVDRFDANLNRRWNLIAVLSDIRQRVAEANAAANIDQLLNDLARLEKDIVFFTPLVKLQQSTDVKVIEGKLEKIRNSDTDNYYRSTEITTSIFDDEQLRYFRDNLATSKKKKQALQDKLLEINVKTTIDLSDTFVQILTTENIL